MKNIKKNTVKKSTKEAVKKVTKKAVKKVTKKVTKKAVIRKAVKKSPVTLRKELMSKIKTQVQKNLAAKALKETKVRDKVADQFRKATQSKTWQEFIKMVDILAQRWSSEKKYEDFNSYITFLEKKLPEDFKMVRMYKDFTVNLKYKTANVIINTTPREIATNLYFNLK